MNLNRSVWVVSSAILLGVSGCVLAPRELKDEERAADIAGRQYQEQFEKRSLPELPAPARWQDVLSRAFLANGELEAGYFEWRASLERVKARSSWPNTNLAPSFSYMFSSEAQMMKSFDRTMGMVAFDPMENLSLPNKTAQSGKVAFAEALSAREKLRAMKFDIQKKVLDAYYDLALMQHHIAIERENVNLLKLLRDNAAARLQAGGMQADLTMAQIEFRMAENELHTMEQEAHAMEAMLNGMLLRDATAPLTIPNGLPPSRPLAAADWELIAAATDRNPELASLAHSTRGRKDALELAKMMWLPDINPTFQFQGSMSQSIGAMIVLPTNVPRIKAEIEEARAMLRAGEAMTRQTKAERSAKFVAALYAMRNAERQAKLFHDMILPQARQGVDITRQAYVSGSTPFTALLESQRTLLDAHRVAGTAHIEREKRLAEMEQLAGVDIETLVEPKSSATTQATQSTQPARPSTQEVQHHE